MKVLEGYLNGKGMKIGIVAARFNEFIVSKLVSGAEDALVRHGVDGDDISIAWVPGAFEIPTIAQKWQKAANMTPSCVWVQSSAAQPATMTTFATKFPKAQHTSLWKQAYL